jgi:hypothetical protein
LSMTLRLVVDAYSPEAMSGVSPSAKDDLAIECDFAAGGVEEYFTAGVTENWNGEKIVCQTWKGMGHSGVGG